MLSRDEAKAFYDRFGSKQDWQSFYEDRATRDLLAHADFARAEAVCEFGCGTGRFAQELLAHHLPQTASYLGCDVSRTMVGLARERLARFGERAEVRLTDGSPRLDVADDRFDRFVSNYVLDLLSVEDITHVLAEAHRLLRPEGLLCLVSLTDGTAPFSRCVTWAWTRVHRVRPSLVGGCRPLQLLDHLPRDDWEVEHRKVLVAFGLPSEVLVARTRPRAPGAG